MRFKHEAGVIIEAAAKGGCKTQLRDVDVGGFHTGHLIGPFTRLLRSEFGEAWRTHQMLMSMVLADTK